MSSSSNGKKPTVDINDLPKASILEIHGYSVGKTLGSGSYATVKEATSARNKNKVAIKIITKKKAPSDFLEKFLPREIDVIKYLKHPSLVLFYQYIETTNRVYIVMELAPNGDLLHAIKKKPVEEDQAGIWFSQLLEGVEYCHSKGIVHRDLKCENLLLDTNNDLKITDFGFVRAGMNPRDGKYLLSETFCGSYAYAAPEILTGTPYVPQLADIWSCGVILFVMIYGSLPFDDSNHKELLKQVIKTGPQFPTTNTDTSKDVKDLILKILTKRRERLSIQGIRKQNWYRKRGTTALREVPATIPDDQRNRSRVDSTTKHQANKVQSRNSSQRQTSSMRNTQTPSQAVNTKCENNHTTSLEMTQSISTKSGRNPYISSQTTRSVIKSGSNPFTSSQAVNTKSESNRYTSSPNNAKSGSNRYTSSPANNAKSGSKAKVGRVVK